MLGVATQIALLGGTIARIPPFYIIGRTKGIKLWKLVILSVVLTIFELAGTMILFVVENGTYGGMSYYGGILLLPVFCLILSLVFRIKYTDLMDIVATGTGGMLAVMRLQCLYYGCCAGAVLFTTEAGVDVRFPSRTLEILTVVGLTFLLLKLRKNRKFEGILYPVYLLLYGIVRFSINWFRDGAEPFLLGMPAGNFWSLVAIIVSIIWILLYKCLPRINKQEEET